MIPTMKRIGKEKETSVAMVVVIFCGGFHRRRRRTERRFIRNSRVCVVLENVRNIQRANMLNVLSLQQQRTTP